MFLSRVGVKPGEIGKLQAMPSERLIDALTASGDISTTIRAGERRTNRDDASVRADGVVTVGSPCR